MAENDALLLVFTRNAFYKRMHYLALGALTLTVFVIIILILMLAYLLRNPEHPLYFATDNVGRLIQILPVDTPNMTTDDVSAWAVEAVEAAFSFDFVNYRSEIQGVEKYFTRYGWVNFMKSLKASNNLLAVTQQKMVMSGRVVGQPKLLAQGILSGAFAWKFQMPMLLTFMKPPFDGQSKFSNAYLVTVIVQRQPILQSYKGLGIVQLIAESAATAPSGPQQISNTPS